MRVKVTFSDGTSCSLRWSGAKVVADSTAPAALQVLEYLNGEPALQIGDPPNENGTSGYVEERRKLLDETEFLLVVGSLADLFSADVELDAVPAGASSSP